MYAVCYSDYLCSIKVVCAVQYIETNEICRIAKNTFEKSYSKLEYTFLLSW
jgi:hypothetical protein